MQNLHILPSIEFFFGFCNDDDDDDDDGLIWMRSIKITLNMDSVNLLMGASFNLILPPDCIICILEKE